MKCPKTENLLLKLWSMRTISSRKLVSALAPPLNSGLPFEATALSAGKIPALSRAAAFWLIMQVGMTLPGNCPPEVIPCGGAPLGQLAKSVLAATCAFDPVQGPAVVPG